MWTDDLVPGAPLRSLPAPPATPRRTGRSGAIAALVVVVMLGVLAVPISSLFRDGSSFWPARWDPRIAPIAQRAEKLRALSFAHPVAVRFLSEAAFKRLVGGDSSDATDSADIERGAATFRALGFISGKFDLSKVTKQANESGILAFYDVNKKEVVVRGTTLDVSHRATLAHELVHVLQDQHFDIRSIERRASEADERAGGSSGAMLALIEGDANNVMHGYLRGLSEAERAQYDREQGAQARDFRKAAGDIPAFIQLLFSAPYDFGPLTIRVLIAAGGNGAVNTALTGPIPTSADFVQAGLVAPPPAGLAAPTLAADERPEGTPESFGAFELYLMLAARGDPGRALMAADTVLGGRAQGLHKNGSYCYRATIATRDEAAATFVAGSVRQWEALATRASVRRLGTSVTFTACDPGAKAVGPASERLEAAALLLGGRSGVVIGAAEEGVPPDAARCVARLFAQSPDALSLLEQLGRGSLPPAVTERVRSQVRDEAVVCRDNPRAGLL
jgi:hypothetical protein